MTLSFLVKSGSNKFSGNYLFAHQTGDMQGNNVTPELRAQGFDPGNNKFTRYNDISLDLGGPIIRDKLWFYGAYGYNYSGLLIPGFISIESGEQVEYFTRLDNPTFKLTYQISRNNKFEITEQLNRKWQPYRNASTFVPMEATQNQIAWTAIGPAFKFTRIMNERMTFDASFNRSGYWWPDYAWTDDARTMDLTTTQTRGAFLELRRDPVRWGYNGTWSWFKTLGAMNHEIKSGVLGYSSTNYVETYGYPNQQIYRYRSLPGETNYFLHPDSVQVFEYPNNTNAGIKYHSWFANDSVNLTPKLTVNAGVRFDHYSSWLPEQGNPGTGPYATPRVIPETHGFPDLQRVVASPVGGLRHHRLGTHRAQGELRALRGVGLRREQCRGPGRRLGESGGDAGLNLHALGWTHSVHADPGRPHIGDRLQPRHEARFVAQGRVSR